MERDLHLKPVRLRRLSPPQLYSGNVSFSFLALIEDNVIWQRCTKMLGNLTFVVKFTYFCFTSNKGRKQLSLHKKTTFYFFSWSAFFLEITSNFLGNLVKLVESTSATITEGLVRTDRFPPELIKNSTPHLNRSGFLGKRQMRMCFI